MSIYLPQKLWKPNKHLSCDFSVKFKSYIHVIVFLKKELHVLNRSANKDQLCKQQLCHLSCFLSQPLFPNSYGLLWKTYLTNKICFYGNLEQAELKKKLSGTLKKKKKVLWFWTFILKVLLYSVDHNTYNKIKGGNVKQMSTKFLKN